MVGIRASPARAGTHSQELGCWKFVYRDGCGFGGFCWFWHGCGAPDLEKFGGGRAFFVSSGRSGRFVFKDRCGFGGFGWFWHGCGAPDFEKIGGGRAFFASLSSSGANAGKLARGSGGFGGRSVLFSRVRAARGPTQVS